MALEPGYKLWTHPIYANADFVVDLEYQTEIQRSRDGTELRRAWRSEPRKSVGFTTLVGEDCYRSTQRALYAHNREPWAVPDESRLIDSTSGMAGLSNQITVGTIPTWCADAEVIVLRDKARVEVRTISSSGAGVLTFLEANSGGDWPIGTDIMPALPCRMADPIQERRRRPAAVDFQMSFDVTPGFELYIAPPAAPVSFNARELFTTAPSKIDPIDTRLASELEIMDVGIGLNTFTTPIDYPTQIDRLLYRPCSAAAAQLITDFFMRNKGRRGSFYMPTFGADMRPVGTSASGGPTLTVYGTDINADLSTSPVFTNVAIQYADLSWQAAAISAYGVSGSNTVLTLGSNLTQNVNEQNIRRISWLPRRRLAADRLSVSWRRGQPELGLAVQTLEDN